MTRSSPSVSNRRLSGCKIFSQPLTALDQPDILHPAMAAALPRRVMNSRRFN
jgi:hypothetical protein